MTSHVFTQTFGVAGAIIEKDGLPAQAGKVLLVKENCPGLPWHGTWNQPAGWIEVGDDIVGSVIKEVKEETGFDFEPTGLVGIYSLVKEDLKDFAGGNTPHALKFILRGKISGSSDFDHSEIAELGWFTPEEIYAMDAKTLRDLDIKDEVRDYFAGKNYPLEILHHTVSE